METGIKQSGKPFEPARDYTKVPNAIFRLYTRLPDFKAEHALLYAYLCAQYNAEYGYAFPDTWDIMQALNCGERSVAGIKSVLVACGLIEVHRHPTYGNDVYIINAPITDEDEFYARFPEAAEHTEKRRVAMVQRRETGALRKRAFDERVRNRNICDR
ncbi:helix-turn-helix domain-containing protein [Paenibacillus vini]|uniref:Helix-turn-helix domain-containing protein n=1 Tax=Paenibacillus vini TaxID=1476024 RepID=A0ABQ4MGZ6_9BACL|nr:helix-turn-helix domain-containing protein [Paenibacillus vini]GIP55262.1 hypothetical protein J42TS3_42970 [Paenibacillus vini]